MFGYKLLSNDRPFGTLGASSHEKCMSSGIKNNTFFGRVGLSAATSCDSETIATASMQMQSIDLGSIAMMRVGMEMKQVCDVCGDGVSQSLKDSVLKVELGKPSI